MKTRNQVAWQCLSLGLLSLRAQAENKLSEQQNPADDPLWAQTDDSVDYEMFGEAVLRWGNREHIVAHLDPADQRSFAKPLGEWNYGEIFEGFWQVESLKALLWHLGLIESMPSFLRVGDVQSYYAHLPFDRPVEGFVSRGELQPANTLQRECLRSHLFWWRLRTETARRDGAPPPPGDSYEALIQRTILEAREAGLDVAVSGQDMLIEGQIVAELSPADVADGLTICERRQLALQWALE